MSDVLAALHGVFEWIDTLESSIELRGSIYLHPWITVLHVLGMCLFAGTVLMMDLRLLGAAHMATPFSQVQRRLFPWQMAGMVLAAVTGLALVYANPMNYATNVIFWSKMLAMGIAGLNALAFHFVTESTLPGWDTAAETPVAARLAGGISLLLWSNVIVLGRLIPYALTWFRRD